MSIELRRSVLQQIIRWPLVFGLCWSLDFIQRLPARLRPQPNHPERMQVNSRGQAALREAHGTKRLHHPTL